MGYTYFESSIYILLAFTTPFIIVYLLPEQIAIKIIDILLFYSIAILIVVLGSIAHNIINREVLK